MDLSCLYSLLNAPDPITSTYVTYQCFVNCYPYEYTTVFYPPFIYSYQCGIALLQDYVPVFIMMFLVSGVILPLLRLIAAMYFKDSYKDTTNRPYLVLQRLKSYPILNAILSLVLNTMVLPLNITAFMTFYSNYNDVRSPCTQSTDSNDISNPIAPVSTDANAGNTGIDLAVMKAKDSTKTNSFDLSMATSIPLRFFKKVRRMKIYGLRENMLNLSVAFAMLVTFGSTYPPLSIILIIHVYSTTIVAQICMSLHLKQLRNYTEQYPNIVDLWQLNLDYEISVVKDILFSGIPLFTVFSLIFMGLFILDCAENLPNTLTIVGVLLFLYISCYLLKYWHVVRSIVQRTMSVESTVDDVDEVVL